MPKLVFTANELADYFNGKKKNELIEEARRLESALRVHAEGTFPEALITEGRPNESLSVLEYRKKIYKAKTKPVFNKIFNSLSKIRRSSDWSVTFEKDDFPKIPEGERLSDYANYGYPYFGSITNWAFQSLLREYLIDPNAIIVVTSDYQPEDETEFLRPYARIINSSLLVDFRDEDYCVYENEAGSVYYVNGVAYRGKSFYVLTTMETLRYDQSDSKGNYSLALKYEHNLSFLPAYKIGAVLTKSTPEGLLHESRISGVIPSFDEAAREYSDLQAAVVMHIYPERWEYATITCHKCNGTGKMVGNLEAACDHCKGAGVEPNSPFSKLLVKAPELGQQAAAVPPAGYVEKDVEIVKLQDTRVRAHLYDALAAINMEFLADTPLAESGVAKEVDRDETNNFVHSVAEDIIRCLDWVLYAISRMRYSVQYPGGDVEEMLPVINVPEHFDIFSTKFIEEELKNAKDNKLNPILITEMETEYAIKKFSANPDVQKKLMLILTLDPLANVTEDEKMSRLTNKGITLEDYVLSCNIQALVDDAIAADKNFANKPLPEQKKVLLELAEKIIESNESRSTAAISQFMGNGGNGMEGKDNTPEEETGNE